MYYFSTSTIKDWIIIFDDKELLQVILNSLDFQIKHRSINLNSWVIMPNHIHIVVESESKDKFSVFLRDFQKYTSQELIRLMKKRKNPKLSLFEVNTKKQKYKIWQRSHAVKEMYSEWFIRQKVNYIHKNPCQEHWQLVDVPEDYLYSSARDYILFEKGLLDIVKI